MKTPIRLSFLSILISIVLISWVLYPDGSPGGKTGSPGDGGANCTDCHSGTSQQAVSWITTNIPVSGYIPGQTYTVTATATHSGAVKYGFEITAEDAANAKKGTFTITDVAQTRKVNSNLAVTHTAGGTTPQGGSKSWSFDWTAPAAGTGAITFYGAFNGANGDGGTGGDKIYLSSLAVIEGPTGVNENLADRVDIGISPNPFGDFMEISFGKLEFPVQSVMISNLNGQPVYHHHFSGDEPEVLRIDAKSFAKGVYIVGVIFSNSGQASYTVIRK
jgi:hypothetical protein